MDSTYTLNMECVSGDGVEIFIRKKANIIAWLKKLDHEGATWSVLQHGYYYGAAVDITDAVMKEYQHHAS